MSAETDGTSEQRATTAADSDDAAAVEAGEPATDDEPLHTADTADPEYPTAAGFEEPDEPEQSGEDLPEWREAADKLHAVVTRTEDGVEVRIEPKDHDDGPGYQAGRGEEIREENEPGESPHKKAGDDSEDLADYAADIAEGAVADTGSQAGTHASTGAGQEVVPVPDSQGQVGDLAQLGVTLALAGTAGIHLLMRHREGSKAETAEADPADDASEPDGPETAAGADRPADPRGPAAIVTWEDLRDSRH